jgi:hypothetical protein
VDLATDKPATVFSNETLRAAMHRMARMGRTRLLVVNAADASRLVGGLALHDLLKATTRHLEEEQRRQRVLPWEYILPQWLRPPLSASSVPPPASSSMLPPAE